MRGADSDFDEGSRLEDLLSDFIARREAGEKISADDFVAQHPEEASDLRQALWNFESADNWLPGSQRSLPERIDGWRILGFVAQGSFGRVLRVLPLEDASSDKPTQNKREFALKLLHESAALSPRVLERFQRECAALRNLHVDGIVRCHAFGVHGACPYVVLDLIDGPNLAEIIARARAEGATLDLPGSARTAQRCAMLIAHLARSVHALHQQGLLHRDLKPANVILDERNGRPVLIDFGLVAGAENETLTLSGDVLGTPAYMSPEQARGEICDVRSDVFGLGGILYELLTLEAPRAGRSSGSAHDELQQRGRRRRRIRDPKVPRALATICERALSFSPRWRHTDAAELADELEAFADGRYRGRVRPLRQRMQEVWLFKRATVLTAAAIALALLSAGTYGFLSHRDSVRQREYQNAVEASLDDSQHKALAASSAQGTRPAAGPSVQLEKTLASPELVTALHAYQQGKYARAMKLAAALREKGSHEGAAALCQGLAALKLNKLREALQALAHASQALPNSRLAARKYLKLLRSFGLLEEAQSFAHKLRKKNGILAEADSRNAELWHEVAKLALTLNENQQGQAAIQEALRSAVPRPSLSMLNTAAILASQANQLDRAHEFYQRILHRDPNYVLGRFNEAHSFDKDCRLEDARRSYEQVLALDPKYSNALIALAWLHSGSMRSSCEKCAAQFEAHPQLASPEAAKAYLLRALRASGGRSSKLLATASVIAKRLDKRREVKAVLEELREQKGISNRRLGRLTRAIKQLDRD